MTDIRTAGHGGYSNGMFQSIISPIRVQLLDLQRTKLENVHRKPCPARNDRLKDHNTVARTALFRYTRF